MKKKIVFTSFVLTAAFLLSGCAQQTQEEETVTNLPLDSLPLQAEDTLDLSEAPDAQASHMVYGYDDLLYTGKGTLVNLLTLKAGDLDDDVFRAIEDKQMTLQTAATSYWQNFLGNEQEKYLPKKEQFFCSVSLLGYDDQYAYTKTLCQGYSVNENGVIEQGTGQGDWIRFEYAPADLSIVDFKMIGNDTAPNRLIPDELLNDYNK